MSQLDLANTLQKVFDPSVWLSPAEHLLVLV